MPKKPGSVAGSQKNLSFLFCLSKGRRSNLAFLKLVILLGVLLLVFCLYTGNFLVVLAASATAATNLEI